MLGLPVVAMAAVTTFPRLAMPAVMPASLPSKPPYRRCGTCRHWGFPGSAKKYRLCRAIHNHLEDEENEARARLNGAFYWDGDDVFIETTAEFGCNLWEEKSNGSR